MKCLNCGYDNDESSLFCEACGSKLIPPVSYDPGYGKQNFQNTQNMPEEPYQWEQSEDEIWEEEQRRRMAQREARRREKQKAENRRVVIIGIIIAAIIAAAGVAAFFGIRYFMNKDAGETATPAQQISQDLKEQIEQTGNNGGNGQNTPSFTPTPLPTQAVTAQPTQAPATPEPTPTAEPTPTVEPTPTAAPEEPLTITVQPASAVSRNGYSKVSISSADASSTIVQEGYNNSVQMVYDGDETTSWQDGIDGEGVGEFLHFKLNRSYDIRYITFKMGNWRDQEKYDFNSRPKDITIWIDSQSFQVQIPNGKTEYCVVFSKDVSGSEVYVRIDSVYAGTEWDDTCISEMGIYGK